MTNPAALEQFATIAEDLNLVHPTGIEPVSTVPETAVLSVELRVRV
jgi:hypothetical protein